MRPVSLRAVVGGVLNLSASNFLRELAHSRVGVTGYYCLVSSGANPRYALHPEADHVLAPARAIGETCGAEQPESEWEALWPTQPIVSRYCCRRTAGRWWPCCQPRKPMRR